jgi:hypothetical protein
MPAMRVLACVVLAAMAGCGINDNTGDDCFPIDGVRATSIDLALDDGVAAVAIGGTQRFSGTHVPCNDPEPVQFISAISDNFDIASATTIDGQAEVTGLAGGDAKIELNTGLERGFLMVHVSPIDHVALGAPDGGAPNVFYVGTAVTTIHLLDLGGVDIVDRNLTVTGAIRQGDQWNRLALASVPVGEYALTIHAGGADWPLTVKIIAGQ